MEKEKDQSTQSRTPPRDHFNPSLPLCAIRLGFLARIANMVYRNAILLAESKMTVD